MGSGPFGGIYYGQYAPEQVAPGAADPVVIDLIAFYQGTVTGEASYQSRHDLVAEYQATVDEGN